jgi:hypothetical protein
MSFGAHIMTKKIYLLITLACLINLSAAVPSMADEPDEPDEVKEVKSRKCISTRNLKNTAVVDDLNVLFFMVGKTVYHNILPRACNGLSQSGRFSYTTYAGSLCELDMIEILAGNSFQTGRSCRLGYFYPVTDGDIVALIEQSRKLPEAVPLPPAKVEDIGEGAEEGDEAGDPP